MKKSVLKLRKIRYVDISFDWISWINDRVVTKYSGKAFKKHTIKTQKIFLKEKLKDKHSLLLGIFFLNEHIGNVELTNISKIHKYCEIRYIIGKKNYWNQGIGSRSINMALSIAFKKLKLEKVYAFTYANNLGSQKVLKKNGFNIEGRMDNFFQYKKSRVKNIILGLNKNNFKKCKSYS